ncbi:putative endoplasmic reticulum membrane protein [Colletotrichum chlorophyti]|uniref:Putative endoplasmic reticulum membrane protein n=1 Tax=Colletotrichum chlorophyti TaxID=708187 RepID=A0A1Q8RAW6_9PEZI|nr:putative endoplasmic reticulum membrane protein [Colletotrichum chlorophyti]
MKLFLGLATALAGVATAMSSDQPVDVYLLQSKQQSSSNTIPSLPRQIARLVLLQRVSPDGQHGTWDLPESISNEKAVDYLNEFGKAPLALFSNAASTHPSQLVVMLEGITADDAKTLQKSLSADGPTFRVGDAPSAAANDLLLADDFPSVGVSPKQCTFDKAINPFAQNCWSGKSSVVRYDLKKDSSIIKSLTDSAKLLKQLATNGEMETIIIAMPESSRNSQVRQWSSKPEELRRRQVEEVMTEADDHDQTVATSTSTSTSPAQTTLPSGAPFKRGSIPSCFKSEDACNEGTRSCSGHGKCVNRYASSDGKAQGTCFACSCLNTKNNKTGSVTHWGGPACQKIDVSVPFWLFTGFGIAIIGALTFAIGLLFNVGEEKLPGVIGAGVSKTK